MDGLESIRNYVKRDTDDSPDRKGDRAGEEEDWESSDKRKHRSSKSRKHTNEEDAEEWDSGGKSTGERTESRKRSGGSSRAGSGDEDDYDARKDGRSKQPKKYLEERSDKKSSSGFQDRESESSRKGRDASGSKGFVAADENERNSSRKTSSKPSSHEGSQSKSRSKVETSHDGELDKNSDRDSRYYERKDSSRDKVQESREQDRNPRRRWDESDSVRSKQESNISEKTDLRSGKTPDAKQGSSRERTVDARNEHSDSKSRSVDPSSDKGTKSSYGEEKRVEVERSRSRGRPEAQEEETRRVSLIREERLSSDKAKRLGEKSNGLAEDVESIANRSSNRPHGEKPDNQSRERSVNAEEDGHANSRDRVGREVRQSRRSQSPARGGRRRPESDDSGSDNDRSTGHKNLDREKESYRDDRSKGRDSSSWSDRNRDWEGPKDSWKQKNEEIIDGDGNFDREREWESQRRERERIDSEISLHRPVYRKGRGRLDGGNGVSDSIEIRPKPSFDFGREESASTFAGRKIETGQQTNFITATNDEDWAYHQEGRARMAEVYGATDGYPDDSSSHVIIDAQGGKGRGQKPLLGSNRSGGGQSSSVGSQPAQLGNNQGSVPFNRTPIQGPKGNNRLGRGGRGRGQGRDVPRVGLQMPMMGPPFVPLGLPPGQMQALGSSMSPAPGPPMGLGIMMSPFGGPNVWPGARSVDMNMLAVPPGLSPIPPGPRFTPNMGTGPNPNMFFNQPLPMRGVNPSISGPCFNTMGTMGRGMPQENAPANWGPPRMGGPLGKNPSRGEQNDYSQNFVDTGKRPQNFIRELELTNTVEDYPKLRELIQRKDEIVANAATPPMYYKCDLREFVLSPEFFGTKFDVILVDPPWEEYVHRAPGVADHMDYWTFEEILNLKIEAIADTPSFIFLWVGDGVGLEQGRQCLKKWGFRRCEDICWVKTNKTHATAGLRHDSRTLFQHTKEHCLMGIKGTVRRSTDGHIIHANIDTDIIIAEEPAYGSTKKPEDIYRIIEHFSLGRRRLELFGEDHNIRSGWCTVGNGLSSSNFNAEAYLRNFADKDGKIWVGGGGRNPPPDAPHLVLTTPDIESLRPKSPPQKNQLQSSSLSLTSMNTANRRPAVNSPQNPNVLTLNQEVSSSTPPTPLPWASSPMGVGLKGAGPDAVNVMLSNDTFFDSYAFSNSNNLPSAQVNVDHGEAESSHGPGAVANML
ncbi:hypothetical protein MKW92_034943 [Papaver armeniacum]|nr:hypothetical protein MKW92_034943 [Papaver armeniacum]